MNFESFIRDRIGSHEFPYDSGSWGSMKKQLDSKFPSQSGFFSKYVLNPVSIISIAAAGIGIYFIVSYTQMDSMISPKEKNKTVIVENNTSTPVSDQNNEDKRSGIQDQDKNDQTADNKNNTINSADSIVTGKNNNEKSGMAETVNPDENQFDANRVPDASFIVSIFEGCKPLTVKFTPIEKADNIVYVWDFGDGKQSSVQSPIHIYNETGNFYPKLSVKYYQTDNWNISPNLKESVSVHYPPEANFISTKNENIYTFTPLNEKEAQYKWLINDKEISSESLFEHLFTKNGEYNVKLIVTNKYGCSTTHSKPVNVLISHKIDMPTAFTPNGDGKNETFGPMEEYLQDYTILFIVTDLTNGQTVFKSNNNQIQWDGTIQGTGQPAKEGKYIYVVKSTDKNGNENTISGTFQLSRN